MENMIKSERVNKNLTVAALAIAILASVVIAGDDNRQTILKAISTGNLEKVKELLQADPSLVNSTNRFNGESLLHYALTWGKGDQTKDIVALLIDKGAHVNATDNLGDTPLHSAVTSLRWNSEEMVLLLLAKGADVNAKNKKGFTPLYYAAAWNSREKGDPIFKALKESGASETSLQIAVARGDEDQVRTFLTEGGDVNSEFDMGETLLCQAVWRGYTNLVLLLLDKGADINRIGRNRRAPLHVAVRVNNKEMTELLINKGARIDVNDTLYKETPLHLAAEYAKLGIAEFLIDKGANTEMKNLHGRTPLAQAVWSNKVECLDLVKLLVAKSADINSFDESGRSVLDIAIEEGNIGAEEFLVKRGAKTKYSHTFEGAIEEILIAQVMGGVVVHGESVPGYVSDERLKVNLKLHGHADDHFEIEIGKASKWGLVIGKSIKGFSAFQRYSTNQSYQGRNVKVRCEKIREGQYRVVSLKWVGD